MCHGPRDPAQLTEKSWRGITQSMFPCASVNPDERKLVMDFLVESANKWRLTDYDWGAVRIHVG